MSSTALERVSRALDNPAKLVLPFWDGECGVTLEAVDCRDEEIVIHHGDNENVHYDRILHSRSKSPALKYALDWWGPLDFFYQPELTNREKEHAIRPERIVGSYAVYHKWKSGHHLGHTNYRSGKATHIERPWARDARGSQVWCDLRINPRTGLLTQTLPFEFWQDAAYPILVDPTFGYPADGSHPATTYENNNIILGNLWTLGASGTTVSMSMYGADGGNAGALVQMAVYSKAATHVLLDNTGSVALPNFASPAWKTANLAGVAIAADDWYLLYNGQNDTYGFFDTGLTMHYKSRTFGTWGASFTDDGTVANQKLGIYLTYSGGAASVVPQIMNSFRQRTM